MNNKKIVMYVSILILILIVLGAGFLIYKNNKKNKNQNQEYIPQEEITDEQSRQTIVSLFFVDRETGQLSPEARLVDIKDLVNLPYEKLANLLIEGPKNEKLKKIIPDNTKVLKSYTEKDCLVLDFSSDILSYDKEDKNTKQNLIHSIVYTMTQFTEINSVKILVEGEEKEEFKI